MEVKTINFLLIYPQVDNSFIDKNNDIISFQGIVSPLGLFYIVNNLEKEKKFDY